MSERTLARLDDRSRRRGEPKSRTAERLIDEGLRMEDHPGIVFRDGPAGSELRSLPDAAVFAVAQRERRAVVTENVGDFIPLANETDQRGEPNYGLVLVDPTTYPRGARRTLGRMVTELDRLLGASSTDEPNSLRHWL
jgi:Domain of unknown function (DUF5615)